MRRAHTLLLATSLAIATFPAAAQVSLFPTPQGVQQSLSFSWSGPLDGAARALAAQLGYTAWTTMASGLPIPRPPPSVDVLINVNDVSAADIVVLMNQQAESRAVIVLDPEKRFIQVVYYG
jgi:DotD protein